MTGNMLVTATPPTPNGELHLGHLSGPYLAADVFARHQNQLGTTVAHLTGIDDHQSYTEARAVRDGTTAAHVADLYGERIARAWSDSGIRLDAVGRPRAMPLHRELTRRIFAELHERGDIVARTRPLPYCVPCDRWTYEAYVAGACPHCASQSGGNSCESCGKSNDCADLVDPRCTICGTPCEIRSCERLYMPLERHRAALERFWGETSMNGHLTALCQSLSADGLPEIAVTHPADWGIEAPVEGFTEQRIYVWFEMAAGYLACAAELGDWRAWWTGDAQVVQFFGYDNGFFHAVLFPAIFSAWNPAITLPKALVSNEFYRLDGLKFSTSRKHAIWLLDALERTPADHLRLFLCWDRPAAAQTSFTQESFDSFLHGDLLPRWHGWLTGLARRAATAGAAPADPTGSEPEPAAAAHLRARTRQLLELAGEAYALPGFSPRSAISLLDLLVREAAEAGQDSDHQSGVPGLKDAHAQSVSAQLSAAAALAVGLHPVAPAMAQQLWAALRLPGDVADVPWERALGGIDVPAGAGDLDTGCALFAPR
ncbi:class I tRNA ligase family protein [Streptomyces sp. NPDC127110]|uniref:class I tRNA ligase family protein n=1 Tax=Streptomyces sp. NPDC127110 TaxID=3345362 RepID=UPI003626905A